MALTKLPAMGARCEMCLVSITSLVKARDSSLYKYLNPYVNNNQGCHKTLKMLVVCDLSQQVRCEYLQAVTS